MLPSNDHEVNAILRAADERATPEQHRAAYLMYADNDPVTKAWFDELDSVGLNVGALVKEWKMSIWERNGEVPEPAEGWAGQVRMAREHLGADASLRNVYERALRNMWSLPMPPAEH